jgi:hypothetical protein
MCHMAQYEQECKLWSTYPVVKWCIKKSKGTNKYNWTSTIIYLMPYCATCFDLTWPQSDNPFFKTSFKQGVQNLERFLDIFTTGIPYFDNYRIENLKIILKL